MTDLPANHLISVDEAIAIIDACDVTIRAEEISLHDADRRVLAQPVRADRDYPPFDKSLMDGYAVRAVDVSRSGVTLRRIDEASAGRPAEAPIGAGECVTIMTGAPLPEGADAVVPVERVMVDGDRIRIQTDVRTGQSVSQRASEARAGEILLEAGRRLGPTQLGVCAQVGVSRLRVAVRPRVGVLSTGNEVVPYDTTPSGAQIRNSNSPLLMSLVRRYGCEPVDLGHVPDDAIRIADALRTPGLDAILVTGGMSMGAYDYTPGVMRDLGYELKVTKLRIKPGKPFVMGQMMGLGAWGLGLGEEAPSQGLSPKPQGLLPPFIFGLPGNPVSAFVCTVRLASRLLLRLQGMPPEPRWITAAITTDLPENGPRESYQPVVFSGGEANLLSLSSSGDLFTLARANALLFRTEKADVVPRNRTVRLIEID